MFEGTTQNLHTTGIDNSPLGIYRRGAAMENELRGLMAADPHAALTTAKVIDFNQLIQAARGLAPDSIALREDVEPVESGSAIAVDDAYEAVHVTLLPTIHNALSEPDYATV